LGFRATSYQRCLEPLDPLRSFKGCARHFLALVSLARIRRYGRAEWQHRDLSAKSFAADYGHAGDAAAPHGAHDQVV
jgi:hypothetical protein